MNSALTCFILVLATAAATSTTYNKAQTKAIEAAGKECLGTLKISEDSDVIDRVLYNREIIKDDETIKYMTCITETLEWVDENGDLNTPPMIGFFSQNAERALVEDVFDKCNDSYDGSSVGEKIFNFHACYFQKKKF